MAVVGNYPSTPRGCTKPTFLGSMESMDLAVKSRFFVTLDPMEKRCLGKKKWNLELILVDMKHLGCPKQALR
jgi:hypothetical protein